MAFFVSKLMRWYRAHGRTLPWRERRGFRPSSYAVLVSEIMLQQTQVDRVLPKFLAWIKIFPNWDALASASTPTLLHAWAGLGYNRRALHLREAAKMIIGNGEPSSEEGWASLKGVGPYTASAVAAFANHQYTIVVDTNIRRVIGRAVLGKPFPLLKEDPKVRNALKHLLPMRGEHWLIPQAIMDLGSAICTAKSPSCKICPLRMECKSAKRFQSTRPPKPLSRASRESHHRNKPYPDRIYRGRILTWVRLHASVPISNLGPHIDPNFSHEQDTAWLERILDRLIKDQLLVRSSRNTLHLPT